MGNLINKVRGKLFGEPVLQTADVNNESLNAGIAFAALIQGVGKAVAQTQRELDETSGKIATIMATTEIDTVQAVITQYGDTGKFVGVKVVTGKTSALSIAVPPALSFKRVHIEGSFQATEFSATTHSNANINIIGANVKYGSGGLGVSADFVNNNTDAQTADTKDSSVGSMSMTAEIRPKPVTALPKPPLIFKGPSLKMIATGVQGETDLITAPDPANPVYLKRRYRVLQVTLETNEATPTAINGKTISLDTGTLDWEVTDSAGVAVLTGPITTANGFYIAVSRVVTAADEAKKEFVVRASLNLLNTTCAVSL